MEGIGGGREGEEEVKANRELGLERYDEEERNGVSHSSIALNSHDADAVFPSLVGFGISLPSDHCVAGWCHIHATMKTGLEANAVFPCPIFSLSPFPSFTYLVCNICGSLPSVRNPSLPSSRFQTMTGTKVSSTWLVSLQSLLPPIPFPPPSSVSPSLPLSLLRTILLSGISTC